MAWWLLLVWLVVSPVLALVIGAAVRFRDCEKPLGCVPEVAEEPRPVAQPVAPGSRLVPAGAAG